MSELVQKLAKGDHKVIFRPIRDDALGELKAAIDRNYVHVKFTETRGGTELGFPLDDDHSDLSKGDFEKGEGEVTLSGRLNLDGVPIRVHSKIDLSSMEGKGHLEILEDEDESEAKAS
jgi:hypothetical protein